MKHLTHEDLLNLREYILEAAKALGSTEESVLKAIDLSDDAWVATLEHLEKESA